METKKGRVHLSFDVVGSQDGQKSPIIFLHGLTSAKESWNNVIRPIADATGRKAYAFDARNHGDSGWSDDFGYEFMQEDLLEFMDCVHAKQAVLVGHSMGGKTAMRFAVNMPERVEKLIVEDISPRPSDQRIRKQNQKYGDLLRYVLEQIPKEMTDLKQAKNFVHQFLQELTPEDQRSSRHGTTDGSRLPLSQDEDGKFRWKTNLKVAVDYFLSSSSITSLNGVYPGPTLMLYGTKSPYKVSSDREFIRQMFPDSQLRAVEGATHDIHGEYGEIFVKEVVEFLNDS